VKPSVLLAYQIIQVAPWAPGEEIERAYSAKAKQFHPDVHRGDARRSEQMVSLNAARALLAAR
jgi:DnaJ-class molecular chaperone